MQVKETHREGRASAVPARTPPWSGGAGGETGKGSQRKPRQRRTSPSKQRGATTLLGGSAWVRKSGFGRAKSNL